jgi:hypothetical protein
MSAYKNGGFPPIKKCKDTNNVESNKKERFFSKDINTNINIKQLLDNKQIKPVIELNDDDEILEVVSN